MPGGQSTVSRPQHLLPSRQLVGIGNHRHRSAGFKYAVTERHSDAAGALYERLGSQLPNLSCRPDRAVQLRSLYERQVPKWPKCIARGCRLRIQAERLWKSILERNLWRLRAFQHDAELLGDL